MVYLNYRLDTILCYYPGCSNIKQCCQYHSGQLRYTILFQNDIFYRGSYNKLSQHIYILFFHRLNLMHLTPMHIMQVSTDHINTKVNIHFPHSFRPSSLTLLSQSCAQHLPPTESKLLAMVSAHQSCIQRSRHHSPNFSKLPFAAIDVSSYLSFFLNLWKASRLVLRGSRIDSSRSIARPAFDAAVRIQPSLQALIL